MPNQTVSPSRHADYYIKGADLHFQVEHVLFKVHSHFFLRESPYWRSELLTGPHMQEDAPLKKGNTSSDLYTIQNEKSNDFARLLWVFYNTKYGDYSKAKRADWIVILRLAAQWKFSEVKELAIVHIEQFEMDSIKRIQLYHACSVSKKFLFPYYLQLASREEVLELDEAQALGIETLVLIQHARERLRAQHTTVERPSFSPVRDGLERKEILNIVASTFKISLNDLDFPQSDKL